MRYAESHIRTGENVQCSALINNSKIITKHLPQGYLWFCKLHLWHLCLSHFWQSVYSLDTNANEALKWCGGWLWCVQVSASSRGCLQSDEHLAVLFTNAGFSGLGSYVLPSFEPPKEAALITVFVLVYSAGL